ncbi:MAG: DNA polymerase/3'-5' exonuclease PolX [Candidatus Woesearchaeota archaeon]
MRNLEISNLLYEIADILEIKGVEWKPRAYRKAAKSIESLSEDIELIYKKGGKKAIMQIPGIGESIANHIEEYLLTGKVKEWESLTKKLPKGVEELMKIEGLGPKKVELLYKQLKIKNIRELEEAIKKHKLLKLRGFGAKTEENILRGINLFRKGQKRIPLGIALPVAESIVNKLKKLSCVNNVSYAGSLRRMMDTIGDIDILITSKNSEEVMKFFTNMPDVIRVISKGSTKSTVIIKENIQCDLRVVDNKSFGSALQYFTGNKEHNIKLREIAIKKGLKLSEYGLFENRTGKMVAGANEEEIYQKLGLQFIEPELRENRGEIEAAQKRKLPYLLKSNDIKGDFHVHSKWSDGFDDIKTMVETAKSMGYEYIALTDHSKTRAIAHGLTESRIKKQWQEIEKLNSNLQNFKILKSAEVDILPDGSLDYPKEILKKLDVVVAAVHSGFKMGKAEMTKRIIKALENEYLDILAHPTGRLINKREPYDVDIEKIFEAAKSNNKYIEVNAFPERLDIKDIYIKTAIEKGIKLTIGTDSHSKEHLRFINFGVAQARRGWAKKEDILNTNPLKKLPKYFRRLEI